MKPYLEYVRSDSRYSSKLIPCKLEWNDEVGDGLEVSHYHAEAISSQSERQDLKVKRA